MSKSWYNILFQCKTEEHLILKWVPCINLYHYYCSVCPNIGVHANDVRHSEEGDLGIFGFAVLAIFSISFSVFVPKDFAFSVFMSLRFANWFIFFSIWFSIFVKNANSFSVLVSNVVFGFSCFVPFGIRFLFDLISAG